jgi:hypothetical protein
MMRAKRYGCGRPASSLSERDQRTWATLSIPAGGLEDAARTGLVALERSMTGDVDMINAFLPVSTGRGVGQ